MNLVIKPRSWACLFFCSSFSIIATIACTNLWFLLRSRAAAELTATQTAKLILAGHHVALSEENKMLNSTFPFKIIAGMPQVPDIVAIGSSRTNLHQTFLPIPQDTTYFCHSHWKGGFYEVLGILGAYLLFHKKLPRTLILGIDPWFFNKNYGPVWTSFEDGYNSIYPLLTPKSKWRLWLESKMLNLSMFAQVLTLDYFLSMMRTPNTVPRCRVVAAPLNESSGTVFFPDGFMLSRPLIDPLNPEILRARATARRLFAFSSREQFSSLSFTQEFEKLLHFLRQKNCRVIFFLAPYHPLTYKMYASNNEKFALLSARSYIEKTAAALDIAVIGSFDPAACQLKENDFFDDAHLRYDGLMNICRVPRNIFNIKT